MAQVRIEYMALSDLKRHPRNPKDHDHGAIQRSIGRFGYVAPVLMDERTGYLVAGHGRVDSLQQMKDSGQQAPARIEVRGGEWFVPVMRGVEFRSDAEVEAYLVADNRLTELGGWNEPELAALLQDLATEDADLLEATGYDSDDLDDLLHMLAPPTLDQLSKEYGDVDESEFHPVIKVKVEPHVFELYERLLESVDGADESEKFAAILSAAAEVLHADIPGFDGLQPANELDEA